jgi:uncharacterized membrane protein
MLQPTPGSSTMPEKFTFGNHGIFLHLFLRFLYTGTHINASAVALKNPAVNNHVLLHYIYT